MRRGTLVSSRISTEDSNIPSCCDMKHEPKFKPLQGNPAFFESGLSRYIPLETEAQSSSHLPIEEGKLHVRCVWKTGSTLQSKTGNQLSSCDDMWCMELSSLCSAEMNIHKH